MDWCLLPAGYQKNAMFSHYVHYFNTVEINSTYYRIPPQKVFETLEEKTSQNFELIVKLHKEVNHEIGNYKDSLKVLHESTESLKVAGKLSGFLAQFLYSFKNTKVNRHYLDKIKEMCGDIPLFIEFRNSSWIKPATYEYCRTLNIGYCCVDGPFLQGLLPSQDVTTEDTGYVRFHGRNSKTWWDSSKGDRYDYLYTKQELTERRC